MNKIGDKTPLRFWKVIYNDPIQNKGNESSPW